MLGSTVGPDLPSRQPLVSQKLVELANAIGMLRDTIAGLEARLDCIRTPSPKTQADKRPGGTATPSRPYLPDMIEALTVEVEDATSRLGILRSELEV